ncbi:hypothetical protein ACXEGG_005227 [Klebsiella pneumoniae]
MESTAASRLPETLAVFSRACPGVQLRLKTRADNATVQSTEAIYSKPPRIN